jgi:hypothetical protein
MEVYVPGTTMRRECYHCYLPEEAHSALVPVVAAAVVVAVAVVAVVAVAVVVAAATEVVGGAMGQVIPCASQVAASQE